MQSQKESPELLTSSPSPISKLKLSPPHLEAIFLCILPSFPQTLCCSIGWSLYPGIKFHHVLFSAEPRVQFHMLHSQRAAADCIGRLPFFLFIPCSDSQLKTRTACVIPKLPRALEHQAARTLHLCVLLTWLSSCCLYLSELCSQIPLWFSFFPLLCFQVLVILQSHFLSVRIYMSSDSNLGEPQ